MIPGYTGYAVPVENQEGDLFNFQQKAALWKDPNQVLHYYFYLRKKGTLQFSLLAKNKAAGSLVQISIPGKKAALPKPFEKGL